MTPEVAIPGKQETDHKNSARFSSKMRSKTGLNQSLPLTRLTHCLDAQCLLSPIWKKRSCDRANAADRKAMESASFRLEGEFFDNVYLNGEWHGTAWYAMLESEYQSIIPAIITTSA
jgi:hypothetical protein